MIYGFNYAWRHADGGNPYRFSDPDNARFARYLDGVRKAAALGANTLRVFCQLPDFVAWTWLATEQKVATKQKALAFRRLDALLHVAAEEGVQLDLTGNVVFDNDWPFLRLYDALVTEDRWAIQARFWGWIASACAGGPLYCYELTSEPTITVNDPYWYAGSLGGNTYVQRIVRQAGTASQDELARAWVTQMSAAVLNADPETPIGLGMVTSGGKPAYALRPENVGDLLDVVLPHVYPWSGKVIETVDRLTPYKATGKPTVIGETFALHLPVAEWEIFLLDAKTAGVDGFLSFYDGRDPGEFAGDDLLWAGNLKTFVNLRDELTADLFRSAEDAIRQARSEVAAKKEAM